MKYKIGTILKDKLSDEKAIITKWRYNYYIPNDDDYIIYTIQILSENGFNGVGIGAITICNEFDIL